jgi:hypothetical protein
MVRAAWLSVIAALVASTNGCSKSDEAAAGAAGTSNVSAGSGGQGSSSAGTSQGGASGAAGKPSTGPAITMAPDAWSPPADCGGVGDTCPQGIFGCKSPTSACQLEGYVCIPAFDAKKGLPGRTAETPYCAAYTCMTFEQASCFCTGDAGKNDSRCSSPAALAGLCGSDSSACSSDAECCKGFACLPDAYEPRKACRKTCATNDDCSTGCCTDALDTGTKICAAADKCETACKVHGDQSCAGADPNKPSPCCRGVCVLSDNPNYGGCRPRCTKNEDCFETGCCQPFANSTEGFCVDAKFCGCGQAGAACGGDDNPPCCSGTTCLTFDDRVSYSCRPNCTSDADCPGSCCVSINGTDDKACGSPENCP